MQTPQQALLIAKVTNKALSIYITELATQLQLQQRAINVLFSTIEDLNTTPELKIKEGHC